MHLRQAELAGPQQQLLGLSFAWPQAAVLHAPFARQQGGRSSRWEVRQTQQLASRSRGCGSPRLPIMGVSWQGRSLRKAAAAVSRV